MSIKIKVEEWNSEGKQLVKIKKIAGVLSDKKLPYDYMVKSPAIWKIEKGFEVRHYEGKTEWYTKVREGDIYTVSKFDSIISLIYRCGDRLNKINTQLKENRKTRTYVI